MSQTQPQEKCSTLYCSNPAPYTFRIAGTPMRKSKCQTCMGAYIAGLKARGSWSEVDRLLEETNFKEEGEK